MRLSKSHLGPVKMVAALLLVVLCAHAHGEVGGGVFPKFMKLDNDFLMNMTSPRSLTLTPLSPRAGCLVREEGTQLSLHNSTAPGSVTYTSHEASWWCDDSSLFSRLAHVDTNQEGIEPRFSIWRTRIELTLSVLHNVALFNFLSFDNKTFLPFFTRITSTEHEMVLQLPPQLTYKDPEGSHPLWQWYAQRCPLDLIIDDSGRLYAPSKCVPYSQREFLQYAPYLFGDPGVT